MAERMVEGTPAPAPNPGSGLLARDSYDPMYEFNAPKHYDFTRDHHSDDEGADQWFERPDGALLSEKQIKEQYLSMQPPQLEEEQQHQHGTKAAPASSAKKKPFALQKSTSAAHNSKQALATSTPVVLKSVGKPASRVNTIVASVAPKQQDGAVAAGLQKENATPATAHTQTPSSSLSGKLASSGLGAGAKKATVGAGATLSSLKATRVLVANSSSNSNNSNTPSVAASAAAAEVEKAIASSATVSSQSSRMSIGHGEQQEPAPAVPSVQETVAAATVAAPTASSTTKRSSNTSSSFSSSNTSSSRRVSAGAKRKASHDLDGAPLQDKQAEKGKGEEQSQEQEQEQEQERERDEEGNAGGSSANMFPSFARATAVARARAGAVLSIKRRSTALAATSNSTATATGEQPSSSSNNNNNNKTNSNASTSTTKPAFAARPRVLPRTVPLTAASVGAKSAPAKRHISVPSHVNPARIHARPAAAAASTSAAPASAAESSVAAPPSANTRSKATAKPSSVTTASTGAARPHVSQSARKPPVKKARTAASSSTSASASTSTANNTASHGEASSGVPLTTPVSPKLHSSQLRRSHKTQALSSLELELQSIEAKRAEVKKRIDESIKAAEVVCAPVGAVLPARSTQKLTQPEEFHFMTAARSAVRQHTQAHAQTHDSAAGAAGAGKNVALMGFCPHHPGVLRCGCAPHFVVKSSSAALQQPTEVVPFQFATDRRLGQKDAKQSSAKEFVSLQEMQKAFFERELHASASEAAGSGSQAAGSGTGSSAQGPAGTTSVVPFHFHTDKRLGEKKEPKHEFFTFKELEAKFIRKALHSSSPAPVAAGPADADHPMTGAGAGAGAGSGPHELTQVQPFHLHSDERALIRNKPLLSTEDQIALERAEKPFKALPLNEKIFHSAGDIGVPKVKKATVTEPVAPVFKTEQRAIVRQQQQAQQQQQQQQPAAANGDDLAPHVPSWLRNAWDQH